MINKKVLLISLLIINLVSKIDCQNICCASYKLELTLKDSSTIIGYYLDPCYNSNCDTLRFIDILNKKLSNKYDRDDSIKIYLELQKLKFSETYNTDLLACLKKDIRKITYLDIVKSIEIEKTPCFSNLSKDNKYEGVGFIPPVIEELDSHEITLLNQKQPIESFKFQNGYFDDGLNYLQVISFNDSLKREQIENIIQISCCSNLSDGNWLYSELIENYIKMKKELKKQNIIVIKLGYHN